MKTSFLPKVFLSILFLLFFLSAQGQVKNNFDVRYSADITGELTFIANNIVNRNPANTPYNATGTSSQYNDRLNMQYIDIDGDPTTFSSSSAILTVPDPSCSIVRYAGLYWGAVYVNNDRSNIDRMKFKLPGGTYQDLTADTFFDGDNPLYPELSHYTPYMAYKDVTAMVAALPDPNGEYTAANIRASLGGGISGGISGGWTMVVVYENPNYPGKYFSTFHGFATVASGQTLDIDVNGFTTLPAPFPVNAKITVAALEGDNRIGGDGLAIDAFGFGAFTPLANTQNPATNFFNSNITRYDALVMDRTPNSINTLGWDVDLINVNNPFNSVIPNGATSAVLRASSTQDKYDIFFTSFDVEIIEPNVVLEKRVNTPGGTDITGQGVNLAQILDYVLTFQNVGNDDVTSFTIRDILPVNVSPPYGRDYFIPSDFVLPPGVTYTYNAATREVIFTIPDNLVLEDAPEYSIRMRVQVAENCFDFIDACSDLIQNLAYSTYRGVDNTAWISDDPSVTDFNACGFTVPGATNFLLDDLSDCTFERAVELCGNSVLLNAGDGFEDYVWVRDDNGNNQIDPSDPVITDGNPDNDLSTIEVDQVGTYIVDKIALDPCKGFKEIITVSPYGAGTIPHPIIEFMNSVNGDADPFNNIAGEIVQCSADNDLLPKIFLCGEGDIQQLQVNIVDAQSIVWEQLDETSCASSGDNCANKALTCTWAQVGTGANYIVNNEGQYRLSVTYQNGCIGRFYFNVFQNDLIIEHTKKDILCTTPGNITITNLGNSYGFQLVNVDTNSIQIPFSANNGPVFTFGPGENGSYIVEVTQLDGSGMPINNACIFRTDVIGVRERDVTYLVTSNDVTCNALGSINIQVNNAEPDYEYELRLDDGSNGGQGTLLDNETAQPSNNFTFTGLNANDYIVIARTDDGCEHTEQVTIRDINDLELEARVSQHITCKEGNIQMSSSGGRNPHIYAIWSYVDESGTTVISYPNVTDIPASEFQSSQIFDILDPGEYTFVVVDRNNCHAFSNVVTIEFRPAAEFSATTVVDISCFGDTTGSLQVNLIDDNGYQLTYYLVDLGATDPADFDYDAYDLNTALASNTTGYFPNLPAGNYAIIVDQRKGSAACRYPIYSIIEGPDSILDAAAVLVQEYTCLQDAIIEVSSVTGGTAPYAYSLDGVTFIPDTTPNAHRFENLTDGTYTIMVMDATGCVVDTDPITIDPLNEPTDLTFTATAPNCPALVSDVTVTVVNGNPNFVYEIIAPAANVVNNGNNNVFPGLAPGTYTFRATDAKGCVITEDHTILPVDQITAIGFATANVSCFGFTDGEVTFNVGQFVNSYDYAVTGPSTFSGTAQTANTVPLTGLSAGTYTILVTDNDTNCTATASVVLEGPTTALALALDPTQPTCLDDGSVALTASGGWGGYSYTLTNPDTSTFGTNTTGNFSGLVQTGTYTATVTDVNGCEQTDTFVLDPAIAPNLAITPNAVCYDDANGLTLTASVTSGGDGNFEYSLNGGAFTTTNIFTGLAPGTHTIRVRDGKDCTDTESITIDPELTIVATAANIPACISTTDINITATGGDGNYVYAVVADGTVPVAGDFSASNPVSVTGAGDYDVYVRDNAGASPYCEASYDISIAQDAPLALTITNTPILCSGENQAELTVSVVGGASPYQYSLDNGTTYQLANTFPNLGVGNYHIRVRDANNCEEDQTYSITEPFTLSASAAITQLAECNPGTGAEVRIINAQGGTAPYVYSFDGGLTYGTSQIAYLLPGSHTLFLRDANDCTYPMYVTVEPAPSPPNLELTPSVLYSCDGTGTVTITPDDPSLEYTYYLNGTVNTPPDSNVFTGVAVGTHTITVDYINPVPPAPSTLLTEDFGTGPTVSIPQIDATYYCFESQDATLGTCPDANFEINDLEYSVTSTIVAPHGTWLSPIDNSGDPNGRYLAVNVGDPGVNTVVYYKEDVEIVANRTVEVTLDVINLVVQGSGLIRPNILVEIVDSFGNVIDSGTTGLIDESTGPNDWHTISIPPLDPGANSTVDIVIRTIATGTNGNDVAIDNIRAFQLPEVCAQTTSLDVTVDAGREFVADLGNFVNPSCNGSNDGSITFNVQNVGASGFIYQVNGGGFSAPVMSGPVTVPSLAAGPYTIEVRDADDPSCTNTLNQTLVAPTPVVATASITVPATCTGGGIVTAGATGGTPSYTYQLEDGLGTPIAGYDFANNGSNTVFTNLAPGDYLVRARDANGCEDAIDGVLTIAPVQPIVFTAVPTACYSGNNDGEIVISVTNGNGGYQFSLNGGPWLTPSPVTATTYTFANLSAGSYDIEVRDALGCPVAPNTQTVEINPQLTAVAVLDNDLTCLVDAQVTLTANGGSGAYTYEWSNDGGATYSGSGFTGNVFTTSVFGIYLFRVTDTTAPTACTVIAGPVTVTEAETPVISNVVPTDILCNGDSTGMLDVQIDTSVGAPPYVINVVETNGPTVYGTQTTGLPAGDYEVTITDSKGCVSDPFAVSIDQPEPIVYSTSDVPITCDTTGGTTSPGEISITGISGGTAEYTYILTGNNGIAPQTHVTTPATRDHTFTILDFGIYQVDIVDANGCSSYTTEIIASPPNDLDIDVSTLTSDCLVGGTAIVTVGSAFGSGSYQFGVLDSYTPPYASSYQGPDVPGGDTATFTGLTPGITYTFVVYDIVTNCYYFEEADAPINTPSNMVASLDAVNNVSCTGSADGNISFTFSGFDTGATDVQYEIFNRQSNLTTGHTGSSAVNLPTSVTVTNFATLPPGEYYLLLTEIGGANNGCSVSGGIFTIRQSANLLDLDVSSPQNDNCNPNAGIITATGRFGTAPYEYQYLLASATAPTAGDPGWITDTSANVEGGNYMVYVKDAYGCIQQEPITVITDPDPQISLAIVDECVDEGNFEVRVTLNNPATAIAPFQISVNGGAYQGFVFNGSNQYTVTGLSSGLGQTIGVRDLNGCADIETFDIQPPLQFNATLTTLLDCESAPANNAEITINVTAGSGSYDYEIDGPGAVDQARTAMGGSSLVWSGASIDGAYTVTVYDTSTAVPNCLGSIVVNVPPVVLPNIAVAAATDVTCNGADDGAITVTSTDVGTGPYTYEIVSGPGSGATFPIAPSSSTATTATFNGLEGTVAGIAYTIRVIAANACYAEVVRTIVQPNVISNVNPTVTEFACTTGNTGNNASISIDGAAITGGSGTYVRYEFIEEDDPNTPAIEAPVVVQNGPNTVYTETDYAGGSYTINVYDSNGCVGSTTATILPFDLLLSASITANTLTCDPGSDGELTMNVTSTLGDTTKFEYSLDNGATYQPGNVFTGLSAGGYTILARHVDTECIISATETLLEPNTFTISVVKGSDVICYGTSTGVVNFELVDAAYPGGFTWEIYNTNGTITDTDDVLEASGNEATNGPTADINLPAGSYYVSIRQDNNPFCTNTEAFTIAGPSADITGAARITEITCLGNDGTIQIINVAGGWGGYQYYVGTTPPSVPTDYVTSPRFEGLGVGTYEAWVIDSQGCERRVADNLVLADPTPITGSLQVNQQNCTNLQGEIEVVGVSGGQGSNYSYQLIKNGTPFGVAQSTRVFSGLGAGSYEVLITDQWSCSRTVGATLLYEEMNLAVHYDKLIDCTASPDGEITIVVTGGSTNLNFEVTYPDGTTTVSNTTGVFTGLDQVGTYGLEVTDLTTSCVKTITATLEAPVDPVLLPATLENASCFGGSDGSIRANLDPATNTDPVYQYELYALANLTTPLAGPQSSPLFENLAAGTYRIRVISSKGCDAFRDETIVQPTALAISASATSFACAPDNSVVNAVITVNVLDGATTPGTPSGTAPYLYSIDGTNYQTSNTFTILDTGAQQNITVYVTDGNGCPATDTVTIAPLNTFTASVAQDVAITCQNNERVTVSVTELVTASGDTYSIELLPIPNGNGTLVSSTPTQATFDLNSAGSYTFRVTNTTTNCYVDTSPYTIAPYDLVNVTATAIMPVTCFGDGNGQLQISVTGYTGNYDYQVFDSADNPIGALVSTDTSVNPRTISGLSGGNYYVRITETDVPLCNDDSNMVTIISPDRPLAVSASPLAEPTCTNDRGAIRVVPDGGYPPYDISMTNTATGQVYTISDVYAHAFNGLSAGNFSIEVTDSNGCPRNTSVVLNAAVPITANATPLVTDLACHGDTGATISAVITNAGGSGNYEYILNYYDAAGSTIVFSTGEQLSPDFNDLGAGIYSITVVDGWDCGVTTNTVEIREPTPVEALLVRTSPLTCTTGTELELSATGGSGTYEYSTDNATFLPMTSNPMPLGPFGAGTYQYYVRDAIYGCEAYLSNAITEDVIDPLELLVNESAAFINCNGDSTAAIFAEAYGGLGSYRFSLYTDAALTPGSLLAGPQAIGEFRNLPAGTYYVTVTSEDCGTQAEEVVITEPEPLSFADEQTNVSCAGEADGSITVTLSGGSGGYKYAISPNLNQFDTENAFTDLAPGDYTVIAQDENGCFVDLYYTITEPSQLQVAATPTGVTCVNNEDGIITVEITGGTAPYSTAINSNLDADFVPNRTDFADLPAGNYLIFVRDANGCEVNAIVDVDPGVNLSATVTPVYACTTDVPDNYVNITLEDPSVLGDIMYGLDTDDPSVLQLNPDFRNIAPGSHYITIAHANGCRQTVDFEIEAFEPLTLMLEQRNLNQITAIAQGGRPAYSFNFDGYDTGQDNTFYVNRTDTFTVIVTDQNGCEAVATIFMEFIDIELPNFFTPNGDGENDFWIPRNIEQYTEILIKIYDRYGRVVSRQTVDAKGWDGKYNGQELPTGDYWYVVQLNGERDEREFVGHFTLYR